MWEDCWKHLKGDVNYHSLAYLHLGTVIPALLLGAFLLLTKKGTQVHRQAGKVYMVLMLVTATLSLFMSARVGPVFFGHFGLIHLLSLLTIYTVPISYFAVKKGHIKKHKYSMIMLYIGGIFIAGMFALMPGRLLHIWMFETGSN